VVERTARRGGTVVIPALAVGRVQALLYHLWALKAAGRLPIVPVYVDSPRAINPTGMLCAHPGDHHLSSEVGAASCAVATYVLDVEASKALAANRLPKVVISASGHGDGRTRPAPHQGVRRGFQEHHPVLRLPGCGDARPQPAERHPGGEDTRRVDPDPRRGGGAADAMGACRCEWNRPLAPRAEGSARQDSRSSWRPDGSEALRTRIEDELGWPCAVPKLLERTEIAARRSWGIQLWSTYSAKEETMNALKILKTGAVAVAATLAVTACGSSNDAARNDSSVNAAAIAADAARMSADEMHNEMVSGGMGGMNGQMMQDHHAMEMNGMGGMNMDQMGSMKGGNMSNSQPMPQGNQSMPMRDDDGHM
jgi:hypothetical protein